MNERPEHPGPPGGEHDPPLDEAELPFDEEDPLLGETLRALLDPVGDVRSVAAERVDRRLQSRSLLGTVSDLGAVGWETVRHLLTNPADPADGDQVTDAASDGGAP